MRHTCKNVDNSITRPTTTARVLMRTAIGPAEEADVVGDEVVVLPQETAACDLEVLGLGDFKLLHLHFAGLHDAHLVCGQIRLAFLLVPLLPVCRSIISV